MKGLKGFLAAAAVAAALAFVPTAAANPPQPGGIGFICDGITGCYIDAFLTYSCNGDVANGPFQCETTATGQTIASPAPDVLVRTTCQVYREVSFFQTVLVYQSHGTIVIRNSGPNQVTLRAVCGPNEL
jgi:hypothetical protein